MEKHLYDLELFVSRPQCLHPSFLLYSFRTPNRSVHTSAMKGISGAHRPRVVGGVYGVLEAGLFSSLRPWAPDPEL